MFIFFKKYRELKKERDDLFVENARLTINLNKYSESDRMLKKILSEKYDLSGIDLSTKPARINVAARASEILNNPIFVSVINNKRHELIMSAVNESRNYEELVQKRANLLFIEKSILKKLQYLSMIDQEQERKNGDYDEFTDY